MVVQIIDVEGVAAFKPEGNSPVAGDGHCVVPPKVALEGVKSEPGQVHALRPGTAVQGGQDPEQLRLVARYGP